MRERLKKENRIKLIASNVHKLGEGYRVFVKNTNVPVFVHDSEEGALKEAIRLCQKTGKKTWVAKFIYEITPDKVK